MSSSAGSPREPSAQPGKERPRLQVRTPRGIDEQSHAQVLDRLLNAIHKVPVGSYDSDLLNFFFHCHDVAGVRTVHMPDMDVVGPITVSVDLQPRFRTQHVRQGAMHVLMVHVPTVELHARSVSTSVPPARPGTPWTGRPPDRCRKSPIRGRARL